MPPKITNAKWQLKGWLPEGLDFDNPTGTISGTPTEIGTFTVPIFVKTNYGEATEDVKIIVEPPVKDVYAVGAKAETWSENAEPDENGFRLLNMPKAYKLVAHHNGFGALTDGHGYWCCGPCREARNQNETTDWFYPDAESKAYTTSLYVATTPVCMRNVYDGLTHSYLLDPVLETLTKVIHVSYNYYLHKHSDYSSSTTKKVGNALLLISDSDTAQLSNVVKKTYTVSATSGGGTSITREAFPSLYDGSGSFALGGSFDETCYLNETSWGGALYYLGGDKKVYRLGKTWPEDDFNNFTAKKVFPKAMYPGWVRFLSEDGLLNGDPEIFPYGEIKDAWYAQYVWTATNQIYVLKNVEFVSKGDGFGYVYTWELFDEIADIKKFEAVGNQVFILKNDGRLYHKGSAITGLFDEAHDTFTHVFPNIHFQDFTFGANTLTVLKE